MTTDCKGETEGRATLKDIAERTNLSVSTVSLCLNGRRTTGHISHSTRAQVLAVAKELGYERPPRTRKSRTHEVGVFCLPGEVYWEALGDVCHVLNAQDYHPIVQIGAPQELRRLAVTLFERFEIDGAIFISGMPRIEDMPPAEIPWVLVGDLPEGGVGNSVALDNKAAGRLAGEHLWQLGHRVVGGVGSLADAGPTGDLRIAGLREIWGENGAPEGAVHRLVSPLHEGIARERWSEVIAEKVAEWLEQAGGTMTAMLGVNDVWALRTISALRRLGLSVPEDISVIGIDDAAIAELCSPGLTTVQQRYGAQGAKAAELLLRLLRAPSTLEPTTEYLEPRLVVRESTAPPRHESAPPSARGAVLAQA